MMGQNSVTAGNVTKAMPRLADIGQRLDELNNRMDTQIKRLTELTDMNVGSTPEQKRPEPVPPNPGLVGIVEWHVTCMKVRINQLEEQISRLQDGL